MWASLTMTWKSPSPSSERGDPSWSQGTRIRNDSYDQRGVPAWGIYSWFPKTKRVIGDAELGFRAKFDFQWSLLPGNSLFVSFRRVKRKHALGCGWCHMASDDINAHIVLNPATKSPKVFPEWYIYIYIWRFLHHFHCFHSYVQLFDILFIYRLLHLQEVYYNMGKHLLLRCHATWLDWVTLLPQVFERHLYFQRPLTSREATRMTILYLYSLSLGLSTVLFASSCLVVSCSVIAMMTPMIDWNWV